MIDRLLAGLDARATISRTHHLDVHGPLPDVGPDLIGEVERAGLRGRGGAGFPTAVKLAAVAAGSRPVVVVNGTEGEPMSAKDRLLLASAPHLVLDGAVAAAAAVGAREVLVAAPAAVLPSLARALRERERADRRRPRFTLVASAAGYVAGEETAVVAHLEGRPPLPRLSPPLVSHRGYRRRPTLVQNVETLAHLGLIARHGAAWFRELGTEDRPGTMLTTLAGAVWGPGVHEVPVGTPMTDLLARAGGPDEPVRALLVGGYFGAWVAPEAVGLSLDDSSLRKHGASVGAGVVFVLGESSCAVAETARLTAYLAGQSSGQCGPCVHGLAALSGVVSRYATATVVPGDDERLGRWLDMVGGGRGACRHPDGVTRMLLSALRLFRDEFEDHARRGPCERCAAPTRLVLRADGPLQVAA